jgi:hypothetical protein
MRRAVFVLITWMALASAAQPARADLASSLYDDVRDVIEELIQAEIADGVVATMRRDAPVVAFYFDDTLERLSSPYWGSLPRVLKQDVDVVVADFVYFHLSAEGEVTDLAGSATRFFHCVVKGKAPADDAACKRMQDAIAQRRSLIDVECRRDTPVRDRRVACDLGFAALSALEGRSHTRRHVIDAIANMMLGDVDEPAAGVLREVLVEWLENPKNVPQSLIDTFDDPALAGQLADASLDALCGDRAKLREFFEDPEKMPGWACFAVSHKDLHKALGVRVLVDEGSGHIGTTLPFWALERIIGPIADADFGDNALYGALAEATFVAHCKEARRSPEMAAKWPCNDAPRLGPGAMVRVEWLDVRLDSKVDGSGKLRGEKPKEMAIWMRRWKRAQASIDRIKLALPASLQPVLFVPDTGRAETPQLLRASVRMTRLLHRLRQRWYLWSEDNKDLSNLDIGELLELARDTVAESTQELGSAGRIVGRMGATGARDLSDMFRLVVQADHRSLATETLRAGFGLAADQTGDPHQRFFLTLAAYLLDASDGDTMGVTRSAFRAAAKDLLRSAETRGVPGVDHRVRLNAFPRLGMRMAFNEGYAVAPGDDTRRTVVSVEWPTAMLAFTDNAGLELSVLDLVAPLSELALRPAGDYTDENLVFLDAVRPRLGVWLAVPQLSRRLELSAGVGARLVGLDAMGDGSAAMPLTATYVKRTSITVDAGLGFVF